MAGVCCTYHRFHKRLTDIAKEVCSDDHAKYFDNFINNFASDVLDLLCANLTPNSKQCQNYVSPNVTLTGDRAVSFMPALLNTLDSL